MTHILLRETARQRDVVALDLCIRLHEVCNDRIFEEATPLDFANFINLRPAAVQQKPRNKRRIFYLLYAVGKQLKPEILRRRWLDSMLDSLEYTYSDYDKHSTFVASPDASKSDNDFKESIDSAICEWASVASR